MFKAITQFGITRRALEMGLYDLSTWNPRDFSDSPSRAVDGRPYGGGPGMVMSVEPLTRAIEAAVSRQEKLGVRKSKRIYLTPQGHATRGGHLVLDLFGRLGRRREGLCRLAPYTSHLIPCVLNREGRVFAAGPLSAFFTCTLAYFLQRSTPRGPRRAGAPRSARSWASPSTTT